MHFEPGRTKDTLLQLRSEKDEFPLHLPIYCLKMFAQDFAALHLLGKRMFWCCGHIGNYRKFNTCKKGIETLSRKVEGELSRKRIGMLWMQEVVDRIPKS